MFGGGSRELVANTRLLSEISNPHIAAGGDSGPWRAQRLLDRVCLQVGG